MKCFRQVVCVAALLAAGHGFTPGEARAQEIRWRLDYAAARKEAAQKGLPLVIEFGTDNCYWCRRLESDTFTNPGVARTMSEKFIPLKIDANRETRLTEDLRIHSYPTVILADSDGRILGTIEGFQPPDRFHENLQRALARVENPEWMVRDYLVAEKALAVPDYGKAVSMLKHILEDGKVRPIQKKAKDLLAKIEGQAAQDLAKAKQLSDDGNAAEAMKVLTKLVADYPGTGGAAQATALLSRLAKTPEAIAKSRELTAQELLAQAKEYYRTQQFLYCLDYCKRLLEKYGDQEEADHARQLQASIQANPAWMKKSCDELQDQYSNMLFLLADSHLKTGDRQKAIETFQRIAALFPGTRHAEVADVRARQLRGHPTITVEFKKDGE